MTTDPLKITVLLGGTSEERAVSLSSGVAVASALREAGHTVVAWDTLTGRLSPEAETQLRVDGIPPVPPEHAEPDLIENGNLAPLLTAPEVQGTHVFFPVIHGGAGEDGRLQTLLELAGVPFAGTGRVGCTLAMDKDLTKRLLRDEGIPTAPWFMVEPQGGRIDTALVAEVQALAERDLGYPFIVKPPSGGSTVGLSLVHGAEELHEALEMSLVHEARIMVEGFVRGRELTVGILGDAALPVGEIIPVHEIFDYECKYQPGMAQEIFPADLPSEVATELQFLAIQVHTLLRLVDFCRVDFILQENGTPTVLEANTLPGMSPSSLFPKAGQAAGMEFSQLCDRIARLALLRHGADAGGT